MNSSEPIRATISIYAISALIKRNFNALSHWLANISWWKFIVFALIWMICGLLLQTMLFGTTEDKPSTTHATKKSNSSPEARDFSDGKIHIRIDQSGIKIGPETNPDETGVPADQNMESPDEDARSEQAPTEGLSTPASPAKHSPSAIPKAPKAPSIPRHLNITPPAPGNITPTPVPPPIAGNPSNIRFHLPPEIGQEVSDAIDEAVDDEAARRTEGYRKNSGDTFPVLFMLVIFSLAGMKMLMGGKARAEAQAIAANEAAERETLRRQVSEAKMQMMQAQVEPHFLFNTLASVEFLIETDPPRAGAMQRSLIAYLRAVLPQMREITPISNLGREADIVKAYLNLLKMRMEERLNVQFDIPEGLRSAAFPPMMLQSLVENAIKHGLEPKEDGGTLIVTAQVADNQLRVSVKDDGLGFGAVPSKGTGLGLQSIRERLKLLHGDKAQLLIAPNEPSGVISTLELPYQLAK